MACDGSVALIVNPQAGKDVRRLVAPAPIVTDIDKIGILRRILAALDALAVSRVWVMPDLGGLAERALAGRRWRFEVRWLAIPGLASADDTQAATRDAVRQGVRVIVALGGDGTQRLVAKEAAGVPMLAISTGTNNAFPVMIDATLAGMAAGWVAKGQVEVARVTRFHPRLEVAIDGQAADSALVDVAATRDLVTGSRAIYDWRMWREAVILTPQIPVVGLGSLALALVGAMADPPPAVHVRFGDGGRQVLAPIAPGMVAAVPIAETSPVFWGETVALQPAAGCLAFDGEREQVVSPRQRVTVHEVAEGARVLDVRRCFQAASAPPG